MKGRAMKFYPRGIIMFCALLGVSLWLGTQHELFVAGMLFYAAFNFLFNYVAEVIKLRTIQDEARAAAIADLKPVKDSLNQTDLKVWIHPHQNN